MKKQILSILPAAAFVAGMVLVPSVSAAGSTQNNWNDLENCLKTSNITATCKLGGSFNATDGVVVGDDITLDLNGQTLTIDNGGYIYVQKGHSLTIKNGTIEKNTDTKGFATIYVKGNTEDAPTEFTLAEDATIRGISAIQVSDNSSNSDNNYSTINLAGTIDNNIAMDGYDDSAIAVDGDIKANGPTITVTGTGSLKGIDTGIYQAGASNIIIDGGKVEGASGIITKAGAIKLTNNASVKATGEYVENPSAAEGGYQAATGAGIQIEANKSYAGNITIDITDSTITSDHGDAIQEYGGKGTEEPQPLQAINLNGDVTLTPAEGRQVLAIASEGIKEDAEIKLTIDGEGAALTTLTNAEGAFTTETPSSGSSSSTPTPTPTPTPETKPEAEKKPEAEEENPNTSDALALYLGIVAVSILGLGATSVLAAKSRR